MLFAKISLGTVVLSFDIFTCQVRSTLFLEGLACQTYGGISQLYTYQIITSIGFDMNINIALECIQVNASSNPGYFKSMP